MRLGGMVGGGGSLNLFGLVLLLCRRFFSYDSGVGFGVVGGGLVEQGYASLMTGCGGLLCGLLDESFGCGGPTLASELGQSQLSDVIQRTRVQWELFDYSNRPRTVSNANRPNVTARFQRLRYRKLTFSERAVARILPAVPGACPELVEGAPPSGLRRSGIPAQFCAAPCIC